MAGTETIENNPSNDDNNISGPSQSAGEQSASNNGTSSACSLQTIAQNPKTYVLTMLVLFIYSVVLIAVEWSSTSVCHGISSIFDWRYYLIATILVCIAYRLYLILLSMRCCVRMLVKPSVGLAVHLFFGNAILLLFWMLIGFVDWFIMLYHADECHNQHLQIGYLTLLLLYTVVCAVLCVTQCIFGVTQYRKRIRHRTYISNQQLQLSQPPNPQTPTVANNNNARVASESAGNGPPPAVAAAAPTPPAISTDTEAQIDNLVIPGNQIKDFVQEFDYFDTVEFSRSTTPGISRNASLRERGISSPDLGPVPSANAANLSRRQLKLTNATTMPTLDEMKSNTLRDDVTPSPHALQQQTQTYALAASISTSPGLKPTGQPRHRQSLDVPNAKENNEIEEKTPSFSNLFLGETREMSSTMFLAAKEDNDGDIVCMICLEMFNSHDTIGRLMCHHMFHKKCVYEWLKKNTTCPLCREDVEKFANVSFL